MPIDYAKACSDASMALEDSAHPELAILFQMAATELERLGRIEALVLDANDKLRSAYQIAERHGHSTNWPAFIKQLQGVLVAQSLLLNKTDHLPAATCTAKTFRLPPSEEGGR